MAIISILHSYCRSLPPRNGAPPTRVSAGEGSQSPLVFFGVLVGVFLGMVVIGSEHELFRAAIVCLEIGEQSLVREIKRVGVVPIRLRDPVQAFHDDVVVTRR
jgi:hypothetical protein